MTEGTLVYTSKPFGYAGKELDAHQVVKLSGLRNDVKLVGLEMLNPVPKKQELFECGFCGALFIDEKSREIHGNKHHS